VGRAHRDQRFGVAPDEIGVEAGAVEDGDSLDDVFHKVEGDHGAHIPVKFRQKQNFPFL